MPLFSIQIKNMSNTLIITIIIVFILYCAVAIAYAMKVDNALYYNYPKISKKEMRKICVYVFFWIIFFTKIILIFEILWHDFGIIVYKQLKTEHYERF